MREIDLNKMFLIENWLTNNQYIAENTANVKANQHWWYPEKYSVC